MTADEFFDFLHQKISDAGTQVAFARQMGISGKYLNDVLKRHHRPGKKLLNVMGFQRVDCYIPLRGDPTEATQ